MRRNTYLKALIGAFMTFALIILFFIGVKSFAYETGKTYTYVDDTTAYEVVVVDDTKVTIKANNGSAIVTAEVTYTKVDDTTITLSNDLGTIKLDDNGTFTFVELDVEDDEISQIVVDEETKAKIDEAIKIVSALNKGDIEALQTFLYADFGLTIGLIVLALILLSLDRLKEYREKNVHNEATEQLLAQVEAKLEALKDDFSSALAQGDAKKKEQVIAQADKFKTTLENARKSLDSTNAE